MLEEASNDPKLIEATDSAELVTPILALLQISGTIDMGEYIDCSLEEPPCLALVE